MQTNKLESCTRFCLFKRIEKGYHYVHQVNQAKVDNKNQSTTDITLKYTFSHPLSHGYQRSNTFLKMLPSME